MVEGLAGLRRLPGLRVDRDEVQTNIFFVDVVSDALTAAEFVAALAARGVRLNPPRGNSRTVRFVANAGVTTADIDETLAIVTQVLAEAEAERGRHEPAVPQADVA